MFNPSGEELNAKVATLKLKKTHYRQWLGNGMGYDPADWDVVEGGQVVASIRGISKTLTWVGNMADGQPIPTWWPGRKGAIKAVAYTLLKVEHDKHLNPCAHTWHGGECDALVHIDADDDYCPMHTGLYT